MHQTHQPLSSIWNAPLVELERSPAARRVGRLAADSGLLLSHFEQRHHLPLPDAWIPHDRPDLLGDPQWDGGRLVEHKYRHFRYENPIGSFHPGHRAKWTAHELCHALVGFAWRPGATPFFQSLAARLAEVVPVALWYFFDEDGLRRCPRHSGPLFKTWCPACDAAAGAPGPRDAGWLERGMAFVEGEIRAVFESVARGRSVGHRYATIDLESDALAHTAAHRLRMQSPEFARYLALFHGPELGCWGDLETLAERARGVARALCGEGQVAPLTGGRDRYIAQDVGWRLMQVQMDCGGEVVELLDGLVERLADGPGPSAFDAVAEGYRALCEDFFLPPAEAVFAVGYPFAGYQADHGQLLAGIEATLPESASLIEDLAGRVREFVAQPPRRTPIARRFAAFLAGRVEPAVADVARYEAALAHPGEADAEADAFGVRGGPADALRAAEGIEVMDFSIDPRAVIAALALDGEPELEARPVTLVLRRTGGDLIVAEISAEAGAALRRLGVGAAEGSTLGVAAEELELLLDLGVLQPARWRLG